MTLSTSLAALLAAAPANLEKALNDINTMAWMSRGEIALVVGVLVLLVLAPKIDRSRVWPLLIGIAAAGTVLGFGIMSLTIGPKPMGVDQIGLIGVPVAIIIALLLLSSAELYDRRQTPEAAALILVGGVGAMVLIHGKSLLELALGVEMISLVGAGLTALGQGKRPLEAGFKYFVLSAASFGALLFGMGLIFLATGSLNVPALGKVASGLAVFAQVGVAFFSVGLLFKISAFPLHVGPLDAYTAGPSSFVGYVMVISKLGAAIALARVVSGAGAVLEVPLLLVGIATIAFAVVASFAQTDLRRLLAYSAVAHAGFLVVGAASGIKSGQAVGYYAVGYGVAALLAFASLSGTGTGPLSLASLRPGGALQLGPARAVGLLVALMSMAGVPPLPGFWAKLAVLKICYQHFGALPTALVAVGGVIGIIYYLKPLPDLLAQARETKGQGTFESIVAVALTLIGVVVLSLMPGLAWAFTK